MGLLNRLLIKRQHGSSATTLAAYYAKTAGAAKTFDEMSTETAQFRASGRLAETEATLQSLFPAAPSDLMTGLEARYAKFAARMRAEMAEIEHIAKSQGWSLGDVAVGDSGQAPLLESVAAGARPLVSELAEIPTREIGEARHNAPGHTTSIDD